MSGVLNFSSARTTAKWHIANNKTSTCLFILFEFTEYGTEKQQCRCCTEPHAALDLCKCLHNCQQECLFEKAESCGDL